jgi:hypothetical protein
LTVATSTYRLRLERESDGKTVYQWSGIAEAKLRPILAGLQAWVPILGGIANAKRSLVDLAKRIG